MSRTLVLVWAFVSCGRRLLPEADTSTAPSSSVKTPLESVFFFHFVLWTSWTASSLPLITPTGPCRLQDLHSWGGQQSDRPLRPLSDNGQRDLFLWRLIRTLVRSREETFMFVLGGGVTGGTGFGARAPTFIPLILSGRSSEGQRSESCSVISLTSVLRGTS